MGARSLARRTAGAGRRLRAIARLRLAALAAGARLELEIAPSASIGRIDVRIARGSSSRLVIGSDTIIDDGVEIRLQGGCLEVGDWCELRDGARFMVSGHVVLLGQNLVSWGSVIHCDQAVTLERQAVLSEHVTVTDSDHEHVEGGWHLDQLHVAPTHIGQDTWVAAKATVTKGVRVGDRCVVASGAVVTADVPDDHVATGVPARTRPRT